MKGRLERGNTSGIVLSCRSTSRPWLGAWLYSPPMDHTPLHEVGPHEADLSQLLDGLTLLEADAVGAIAAARAQSAPDDRQARDLFLPVAEFFPIAQSERAG
jgi:hypothetical protein